MSEQPDDHTHYQLSAEDAQRLEELSQDVQPSQGDRADRVRSSRSAGYRKLTHHVRAARRSQRC